MKLEAQILQNMVQERKDLEKERDQALAEVKRLRRLLRIYGRHEQMCASGPVFDQHYCDCGFSEALKFE